MLVIGIVGGIASGKSEVAGILGELGAAVINADKLGHQVLLSKDTILEIQNAWGDRVLDETGNVNRRKLGEIVFQNDSNELDRLEQITHPKIEKLLCQQLTEIPDKYPAVIVDAPVMIKAGWDRHCDHLIFVDCPRAIRLARALNRGWTAEMLDAREAAQATLAEKKSKASEIVDGSAPLENLREQLTQIWQRWNLPLPVDRN